MFNKVVNDIEAPAAAPPKKKEKKAVALTKKSPLTLVLAVLIVASLAGAAYFYKKYQDVQKDPNQLVASKNAAESGRVIENLKNIILIEETDQPTVARVDDPEKLKKTNEDFYKNVQKNDYLVLYPKRAIIFREAESKIVNIAPIISSSQLKPADNQGTTPAETEPDKKTNGR
jgi:predicted S18 family serine protease